MEWRNLRLMWLDDQKIESQRLDWPGIDLVRVRDVAHEEADTWYGYCTALAESKAQSFDLLSIDMNFRGDPTDPGKVLGIPGLAVDNCSGLYLGMMAMATRKATDGNGNLLPLAWEMRTKTPAAYEATPQLLAEAVRAYGLLRSLLAHPRSGESLIACIAREHGEFFLRAMPQDIVASNLLASVVKYDLTEQRALHGRLSDVVQRLLPRWRLSFLHGLREGTIKIDQRALKELIDSLQARPLTEISLRESGIVLQGWQEWKSYGIPLSSILADIRAQLGMDPMKALPQLEGTPLPAGLSPSLRNWLGAAQTSSGAAQWGQLERFLPLNREVHAWLESIREAEEPGPAPFWSGGRWGSRYSFARCLIYMIVHVHGLAGGDWSHLSKSEHRKADALGLTYNDQTFSRPFRDASEFEQMSREVVIGQLEAGLQGQESRLFSLYPWMQHLFRDLLLNWIWRAQTAREALLARKFPGLAAEMRLTL